MPSVWSLSLGGLPKSPADEDQQNGPGRIGKAGYRFATFCRRRLFRVEAFEYQQLTSG